MKKLPSGRHFALFVGVIVAVFVIFSTLQFDDQEILATSEVYVKCENILSAKVQPLNGSNVFFILSDESAGNDTLTARQACSVESAALANRHLQVFLVYSSRENSIKLRNEDQVKAILSYPNVHINFLEKVEFSRGTPMEDFMSSGKLEKSKFRVEHTSDALRLLLLWKYGGTYLDTDMMVQKRLDSVSSNFACRQSRDEINNAIVNFDRLEGHELIMNFITEFVRNYDGLNFVSNGPVLLTRVLKRICKNDNMDEIVANKSCQGFHVLNETACYKVRYSDWPKLMDEKHGDEIVKFVNESLVIHLWNHSTRDVKLKMTSNSAYIKLARRFCPRVIAAVKDTF